MSDFMPHLRRDAALTLSASHLDREAASHLKVFSRLQATSANPQVASMPNGAYVVLIDRERPLDGDVPEALLELSRYALGLSCRVIVFDAAEPPTLSLPVYDDVRAEPRDPDPLGFDCDIPF